MEMHDARIQRSLGLETAVREHLQHLAVLAEHISLELRYAVRIGDQTQMIEQQGADAVALDLAANRERNRGATRIGAADVAADADEPLAPVLGQGRREPDMIFEVELGEMLQIVGRQVAPNPHESKIDRLLAHAFEMIVQALLIVGANRANPHRGAVEHRRVGEIFTRVDRHVVISHRTVSRVYRDFAWDRARVSLMRLKRCMMSEFTIKDKVAIAGLGETKYYKRGGSPISEFRLALEAI